MSKQMDIIKIATRLIACAVPAEHPLLSMMEFPRSGEGIAVPAAKLQEYYSAVKELFAVEKTLATSYALVTFEKAVIKFIAPHVLEGTQVDKAAVREFLRNLVTLPVTEHQIYRPINGVVKDTDCGPVTLGPFTVYHTNADAGPLDESMRGRLGMVLLDKSEHYLIKVEVKAREPVKALELANALFERFERTIRFMVGPNSGFTVSILTQNTPCDKRAIVLNKSRGSSEVGRGSSIPDLDIDDAYFHDAEVGYDRIWAIFDSTSNSELAKKLLLAVDWVGQSIAEKVPSSAFIKAAIALEVLLSPPKEFISASITFQISESVAMLLGTDSASRIRLETEAKRLYSIRSDVAHKGIAEVDSFDLVAMQDMARGVVKKILTAPALENVTDGVEMRKIFRLMKYNCPEIWTKL
ncbi:HEPN domain-containing protein [Janthinobacterium sp. BJB426]|uniref:HEPN domain-containing protein n=1 Tax=Janthinobacterium sp. BJB426 TaxID=2048010 RepID=UPI0013052CB6|nr:HEPN domain-containing protein [Janthinobacterium sp. BJB426]